MAKATVCEQLPVSVDLRDVVVELALVADVEDPAAAGFAVASRLTVAGVRWAEPDAAGIVTFAGVEPNTGDGDDVIDAPTGTVWRRTIRWPDHTESVDHIEVPEPAEDGERLWVPDLLTDAPGALPSTALAAFQASAGLPGGLATLDGDGNLTAAQAPAHGDVSGRSVAGAHPASAIATDAGAELTGATAQARLDDADVRLAVSRVSQFTVLGHSWWRLGATEPRFLMQRRLADQAGVPLLDYGVSGSRLLAVGAAGGGYPTVMQLVAPPARPYLAQQYPAQAGVPLLQWGINDIQSWMAPAKESMFLDAFRSALRAVLAWLNASGWWQHDDASTGQTFGGAGTWTQPGYIAGLEAGPGTGRASCDGPGTITAVTGPAEAGLVTALLFMTDNEASSQAASTVSVTVDGQPADLLGVEGSSIALADVVPSSVEILGVPLTGIAAARVELPDDGSSHTIVATCGAGGVGYFGRLVERPRPIVVANVPRMPDSFYSGYGSDANVVAVNAVIGAVAAEFPLTRVADLDAVIGKSEVLLDGTIHPNDTGHSVCHDALRAALLEFTDLDGAQRRSL